MYPQTNSSSGIAELFYDSSASSNGSRSWSRICVTGSDSSDQYTADTFCTQLGYSGASNVSNMLVLVFFFLSCLSFSITSCIYVIRFNDWYSLLLHI